MSSSSRQRQRIPQITVAVRTVIFTFWISGRKAMDGRRPKSNWYWATFKVLCFVFNVTKICRKLSYLRSFRVGSLPG